MTDHKFTDEEVIKTLECCLKAKTIGDCEKMRCPAFNKEGCIYYLQADGTDEMDSFIEMLKFSLDLINRQKAEIKTLQERNVILRGLVDTQKAEISALTSAVDNSTQEFLKLHDTYQEQKAEIERLEAECERQYEQAEADIRANIADGGTSCHWCMDKHRVEAVKEFAERLKERSYTSSDWSHGEHPQVVECDDINEIVEELTGKGDNNGQKENRTNRHNRLHSAIHVRGVGQHPRRTRVFGRGDTLVHERHPGRGLHRRWRAD